MKGLSEIRKKQNKAKEGYCSLYTSNIISFVRWSERNSRLNQMNFLNENYFKFLHDAVAKNNGELDKIIGDRQMAYWYSGIQADNAVSACNSALEQFAEHITNQENTDKELRFDISIGISSGTVTRDFNLIMEMAVLKSQAMANLSKPFSAPIIIDEMTYKSLPEEFITRELDELLLKGGSREIIYELVSRI